MNVQFPDRGHKRRVGAMLVAVAALLVIGALSVNYAFGARATTPAASGHAMAEHHMAIGDLADVEDELAQVRGATARFHDLDAARDAGYELGWVNGSGVRIITGCVASPTAGAMGYHYFNAKLMADLTTDILQPEVLVYAPGENGKLKLLAVEWVVRGQNSNPPGVSSPPTVLGMPMHILVPAVGFYIMHAWVWKANPAGMFADFNPEVSCP
jgi:hypothetical protein